MPEEESPQMPANPKITVVVPCFNEEDSLDELSTRLESVLRGLDQSFEILFINDGSTDETATTLEGLSKRAPHVGVIHFRRNFGKAAALDAGFQVARGGVVITMDADLQDEPREIPKLLAELENGYDLVSGWKKVRRDPIDKTLPSRLFNFTVSLVSGLHLHDFNCGFKAYRREVVEDLNLYGELHRFIPVLAHWRGFRVGEVPVEHHPRKFGRSKYGASRFSKGVLDLLSVLLNTRYQSRPLHLFGWIGGFIGLLGLVSLLYLTILWFAGFRPIGNRPLLLFGALMVMVGIQLVSTGLLGELVTRSQQAEKPNYVIRTYRPPRS